MHGPARRAEPAYQPNNAALAPAGGGATIVNQGFVGTASSNDGADGADGTTVGSGSTSEPRESSVVVRDANHHLYAVPMQLNASTGSAENSDAASLRAEYLQPCAQQTQDYDLNRVSGATDHHGKPAYATPPTLEEERPHPPDVDEGGYVAFGGAPQLSTTTSVAAAGGGGGSSSKA